MSDEAPKKYPKHEGVPLKFVRFKIHNDLPAAGSQISSAKCGLAPAEAGQSYTGSYHGAGVHAGMYELRHYNNGALLNAYWIPRECIAYHEVLV